MRIANFLRLNWLATIGINHRIGGWKAVLRMPVKVYGRLKWCISGHIVLPEGAVRNTLVIGSEHEDYTVSAGRAELRIAGEWRIEGIVRIGPDAFIGVESGGGLTMGDGCFIGRDSQIHCSGTTSIGKDVVCGETYICDSDVHTLIDNGEETEPTGQVTIGDGAYLAFRTMILKGTVIPPGSVVASGAVCTKDYGPEPHVLLAGVPATIKKRGVTVKA